MADRYWVGGTATWDATAGTKWAATSGGTGGETVPTSADNVFFDVASGAVTVTVSGTRSCADFNCTGFTGTLTGTSTPRISLQGNLTLYSGMTLNSVTGPAFTIAPNSSTKTADFAGLTVASLTVSNSGTMGTTGVVQLASALVSAGTVAVSGGAIGTTSRLELGAFPVTATNLNIATGTSNSMVNLGSSLVSLSAGFSGLGNVIAGTSTIRLSGTASFVGSGRTYYNVELNGTSHAVTGANTFTNLTRTGTATKTDSVTFDNNQVITGTLTLTGNSAVNRLYVGSNTRGTTRTLTAAAVSLTNVDFEDIDLPVSDNVVSDTSTNAFTVTKNGNAQLSSNRPVSFGGSAVFDGSGDYLNTVNNSGFDFGSGDFTVEGFFYIRANSSANGSGNRQAALWWLEGSASGQSSILIAVDGNTTTTGTGFALYSNTNGTFSSTVSITQNSWHHFACVRLGSNLTFYLNGVGYTATNSLFGSWGSSSKAPRIGATGLSSPNELYLNGFISNVRVVKGTAVYTSNFTPTTTPLTAITNTQLLLTFSNVSPATGTSLGDCWGNSGITFTPAVNRYWVGGAGNWSDTARWSDTSGGTGGFSVPLPQDYAYFDSNSGGSTKTLDMPRMANALAISGSHTLTNSGSPVPYGDYTLPSFTWNSPIRGRGNHTLNSTLPLGAQVTLDAISGTYTLVGSGLTGGASTNTSAQLTITSGTLVTNGLPLTLGNLVSSGTGVRALDISGSTVTLYGTSTPLNFSSSLTLSTAGSTLRVRSVLSNALTLNTGGLQYAEIEIAPSTTGSNPVTFTGNFTASTLSLIRATGYTQRFTGGSTVTVNSLSTSGPVVLTSSNTTPFTLIKSGGGTNLIDGVTVSYSSASPATTWYATNSTDGGNNSGWTFLTASSGSVIFFGGGF